jgi:hypothetical protein
VRDGEGRPVREVAAQHLGRDGERGVSRVTSCWLG